MKILTEKGEKVTDDYQDVEIEKEKKCYRETREIGDDIEKWKKTELRNDIIIKT